MKEHDEQFENFLREFQPRRPRALPAVLADKPIWHRRLCAAGLITVTMGVSLWFLRQKSTSRRDLTSVDNPQVLLDAKRAPEALSMFPLTQLALEDPARLDSVLTEASRHVLPSCQGTESTLRVLAKE